MVTGFVRANWTIVAAAWLLLLAGCADFPEALSPAAPYSCLLPAEQHMLVAELFFGRSIKGRQPLTDAEWAEFAAQTITPNFPDGFTVLRRRGPMAQPADRADRRRPDQNPARRRQARTRSRPAAVGGDRRLQGAVPPAIGRHYHPRLLCGVLGAMHPRPRRTQPFAYPATLTAATDSCPMTS